MALSEQVILDISAAQRKITELERQLGVLERPIDIPVNVSGEQATSQLRNDLTRAEGSVDSLNRELAQTDSELDQVRAGAQTAGSELSAAGTKGATAFGKLSSSLGGIGLAIGAAQGIRLLGKFLGESVTAASDLAESVSKTGVVFGAFAGEVEEFGQSAAQSVGLSTQAALEATATFGNLFTALGLTQQQAADLSPDIVQLAADLASFNNIAVDEAVVSLRAGLVGEVEPLRRLGVAINAAAVEQKALELGLQSTGGELTEAAKVQARYALILEQTTNAQGDFARTADGFANSTRTMAAEVENAKAKIGDLLLPVLVDIVPIATDAGVALADAFARVVEPAADMAGSITTLASSLGELGNTAPGGGFLKTMQEGFLFLIPQLTLLEGVVPVFNEITSFITGTNPQEVEAIFSALSEGAADSRDPMRLLGEGFTALNDSAVITVDVLDRLQATTGATDISMSDFLSGLLNNSDALELTAEEIEAIEIALRGVRSSAMADVLRGIKGVGDAGEEAAEQLQDLPTALELLTDIAEDAGVDLAFVAQNAELFGSNVVALVNAIGGADLVLDTLAQGFVAVANSINFDTSDAVSELDLLITKTNEAGEEVPTSMQEMIDDLTAQAQKLADLEAGTLALEALGFDKLAAEIREKGPDAVGALEEFLGDLDKAGQAEQILEEGVNPGTEFQAAIEKALEEGDITPAMLEYLTGITSESVKATVLNNALTLAEEFGAEFQRVLDALDITLSADIVRANLEPTDVNASRANAARERAAGGGGELTPQAVVNLEINNPTTQDLNTDAARAAQTISSVVRVRSGAQ